MTRMATQARIAWMFGAALGAGLWTVAADAHHEITAKFDPAQAVTLEGVVTLVDWRNPHAHVFVNVAASGETLNYAIELESPVQLEHSGWSRETLRPGDAVTVRGMAARDGSRQIWAESLVQTATGRTVLFVTASAPTASRTCLLYTSPSPRD